MCLDPTYICRVYRHLAPAWRLSMWLGSENLCRTLLHPAIPNPDCKFTLQRSDHAKLQEYAYVLLKSKWGLRNILISLARLRYLIFSLISPKSIYI